MARHVVLFLMAGSFVLGWVLRQSAVTFGWGYTIGLSLFLIAWVALLAFLDRRTGGGE